MKFSHINIIAKDWRKLAQFYIDVFGCVPTYPERNLSGKWIENLTNIDEVNIRGIHLRLPGYIDGPTLEIFEYNKTVKEEKEPLINRRGFGHMAFHVENVEEITDKLIRNGGEKYGKLVKTEIEGIGRLTVIYVKDPEGNIIEIQNWDKKQDSSVKK